MGSACAICWRTAGELADCNGCGTTACDSCWLSGECCRVAAADDEVERAEARAEADLFFDMCQGR